MAKNANSTIVPEKTIQPGTARTVEPGMMTRRAALIGAASLPAMALPAFAEQGDANKQMSAFARIRDLSREISHLLNDLPHEQRVTIEPCASAVYPVLIEDMNPDILPDYLAMMNRGLAIMERGAKLRDRRVLGLGMVWGVDGGDFNGVAVHYSREASA